MANEITVPVLPCRSIGMRRVHGKHGRAAEILDARLERHKDATTTTEIVEALAYRAELGVRACDIAAVLDQPTR